MPDAVAVAYVQSAKAAAPRVPDTVPEPTPLPAGDTLDEGVVS